MFRLAVLVPQKSRPAVQTSATVQRQLWPGFKMQKWQTRKHDADDWLVVEPTHLKNVSQIGSFPQIKDGK